MAAIGFIHTLAPFSAALRLSASGMSANLSMDGGDQVREGFPFWWLRRSPRVVVIGEGSRPHTVGKSLSTLPGAEDSVETLPLGDGAVRLMRERWGELMEADRLSTQRIVRLVADNGSGHADFAQETVQFIQAAPVASASPAGCDGRNDGPFLERGRLAMDGGATGGPLT